MKFASMLVGVVRCSTSSFFAFEIGFDWVCIGFVLALFRRVGRGNWL